MNGSNVESPSTIDKKIESIRLYSYSDTIFFWPMPIISILFFTLSLIPIFQSPHIVRLLSWIWIIVFISNIFIVTFDFSSAKAFTIFVMIITIILIFIVIAILTSWNFFTYTFLFLQLPIDFSWAYYILMFTIFGSIILIMVLNSRINYVEITSNRLYIKKGILAEKIDQSTDRMQVDKKIDDVFEYFILKSGDISFTFPYGSTFPIIMLPNVMNVNQKIKKVNKLIAQTEVDID